MTARNGDDGWPLQGGTTAPTDVGWMTDADEPVPEPEAPPNETLRRLAQDVHERAENPEPPPQPVEPVRTSPTDPPRPATAAFSRAAIRTAKQTADRVDHRAGFLIRGCALAVDLIIVGLIASVFVGGAIVGYGVEELRAMGDGQILAGTTALLTGAPGVAAALYLLVFSLMSAYFIYFHGALSCTPGKQLFGLRVITASGLPLTYGQAIARWAAFVLSALLFGLGLLWTAFSEVQQGLHDKISGTYVQKV